MFASADKSVHRAPRHGGARPESLSAPSSQGTAERARLSYRLFDRTRPKCADRQAELLKRSQRPLRDKRQRAPRRGWEKPHDVLPRPTRQSLHRTSSCRAPSPRIVREAEPRARDGRRGLDGVLRVKERKALAARAASPRRRVARPVRALRRRARSASDAGRAQGPPDRRRGNLLLAARAAPGCSEPPHARSSLLRVKRPRLLHQSQQTNTLHLAAERRHTSPPGRSAASLRKPRTHQRSFARTREPTAP
mmetsp:Transcript_1510/g.4439  ORF Transcript_1510/g.4439 Transcript_1510/m.4439 type:complete len:250 (+) Transcript_1510:820-1569(+)